MIRWLWVISWIWAAVFSWRYCRVKEITERSQNTWPTGWHLNYGVPGQLPFNGDFDRTEGIREFSVLRQEWTEFFINLCHCVDYSKSKAREKTSGAAPSLHLLLSIVGGMTLYTARNVAISITGLTKEVSIRSYSFFFFLSVVSLFRGLVPWRRWCFVFIIIHTIAFLSGLLLFSPTGAHWNLSTDRIVSLRSPTTSYCRLCGINFGLIF